MTWFKRSKQRLLWLFTASALLVAPACAQTVFGTLAGTVTDATGALVPGATVTVVGEQTGTKFGGTTTSSGAFRFPEVPIGGYDVTVAAPGFQAGKYTGVRINLQVTTALNVTLQLGATTQTVTVNAGALTLQTESSDITGSITDQEYNDLPLALGGVGAFRSPEAFIFLLPGNTGPGTSNNSDNGVFYAKIAGGQDYGAEVLIDGLSQQRSENGSSFDEESPSVDALRELTVTEALPPAEFNRTTGGFENFVTKSGTNQYHGSAYDIVRNTALDANLWFNGGNGAIACSGANDTPACRSTYATPADRKNDYGVTMGGPVSIPKLYNGKNRLFFFFSWEQLRYSLGNTVTDTVPTPAELGGDFSSPQILIPGSNEGTNPCDGTTIQQGQIFDPATERTVTTPTGQVNCRTAFPGNMIPASRFSPAAVKLLSYFPAASNPSQVFNNYQFSSTSPIANTAMTIRIDADLSQNSHLWGSYSSRDNDRVSGTPQALPYPEDPNTWRQNFTTHFFRLGWDYTFRGNLLNHLIVGSNRSNSVNFAIPYYNGVNYFQQIGIGNASSKFFPIVSNGVTTNEGNGDDGDNVDNGLRLVESVSWQKGPHSLTFGTDIRYQQYSPLVQNAPSVGFAAAETSAYTGSSNNGFGLASELLGDANSGAQNIYAHQSRWISWYYAGYVQDDWKVSRALTLNLGVNYSVDVPRHEADNDTSDFSPTALDPEYGVPGALVFGTQCVSSGCNTKWANTYFKDIAPRIGLAYAPAFLNNNTVFRAGGGILYGPLQYDDFGGSMDTGYKSSPTFDSKNGFDPSFQIDSGYPAFAAPPILDPGFYNGQPLSGSYIEKSAGRPAAIYDWDANVQQQLVKNLILSVGYVGSAGQNLQANNQNLNNISPNDFGLSTHLSQQLMGNSIGVPVPFTGYYSLWGNGVQTQQALRPFPQYDYIDSGCCLQSTGHSSYDALLVSLKGEFKNLQLQASYTWSKNENDTDSAIPNTNPGQPQVQNPDDLHQEKAISIQDIPNTFVASYVYTLPFGHGQKFLTHGLASYGAGGWRIGGIQRYQSGEPLEFCCSVGIPGWENSTRDDLTGASIKSPVYKSGWRNIKPFDTPGADDPDVNSFFVGAQTNPHASTYAAEGVAPAFIDQNQIVNTLATGSNPVYTPYSLGNTPRVTGIRMPLWLDEDFSVIKETPIHENLNLQLKFEFLNVFNRHYFGSPDVGPGDATFGIPTYQANSPRAIQVTGTINF